MSEQKQYKVKLGNTWIGKIGVVTNPKYARIMSYDEACETQKTYKRNKISVTIEDAEPAEELVK
jgi:hypothetical protein